MTRYPRLRMRQTLREQDTSSTWQARAIQQSDASALGALMLAAYRGTVDDEGESEAMRPRRSSGPWPATTGRGSRTVRSPSTRAQGSRVPRWSQCGKAIPS